MMNNLRKKTVNHLISNCAKQFFSGFLTEKDIKQVEELTGEKVECSTESGEYFYRIKA